MAAVEAAIADALCEPGDAAQRLRRALERCVDRVLDDEGTRVLLRNLDEVSHAASPDVGQLLAAVRAPGVAP
jgi:hypothetical protein